MISNEICFISLAVVITIGFLKTGSVEYLIRTPKECVIHYNNEKIIKILERSKRVQRSKSMKEYVAFLKSYKKQSDGHFFDSRDAKKGTSYHCIKIYNGDLKANILEKA